MLIAPPDHPNDPRALARRLQVHYFLLFAPFAIAITYQNLHFRRLGFSDSQIGTLNAIAAILAVVSPPVWGYVTDRVGDKRAPLAILLVASGAVYPAFLGARTFASAAVFQALFSFSPAPCIALITVVALAQGLHALAFGATHIATVTFISASVPNRLQASGQTLYAAVVGGLGGAVGSRLAGELAQAHGIPGAFRICALLGAVAVLIVLLLPERKPQPD